MTKKIERTSKIAEPRKIRKLMIKKNTIKDLTVPARGQQVKGGANTQFCSTGGGG
jgi:hypothetical protein